LFFARCSVGWDVESEFNRHEERRGCNRTESKKNTEHGDASICALDGSQECPLMVRRGGPNLDCGEKGPVESSLPIGSSAVFSDQSVAAFRRACSRFYVNAADCSASFDSFYTFGG
jgi:hypothetical protein